MSAEEPIVVVGGGQAAAQLCESLRRLGHAGPLTLVSDEPQLPYCRPPLSKQYLVGAQPPEWLLYRPAAFYAQQRIDTRLGRRVVSIDRAHSAVALDDGTALPFARLALALGARARRLGIAGDEHVCFVRGLDDATRLRERLAAAREVVVIGGGFIGLEVAAVLARSGRRVKLLAAGPRLLPRVGAPLAAYLRAHHEAEGVQVMTDCAAAEVRSRDGGGFEVATADTAVHRCDLVVAGVGIHPNTELAQQAGLACDDGILVDQHGRSSDARIVAAGDCTRHPNALAATGSVRLETVHNAIEQARSAAATLCGQDHPYRQAPWVWSDQFDLRLQAVGVSDGADLSVARPAAGRAGPSLFHFRQGRFVGFEGVNVSAAFAACRRLLDLGIEMTPQQAADPRFDPRSLPPPPRALVFEVPWTRTSPGAARFQNLVRA